jgi:hypothetical protein
LPDRQRYASKADDSLAHHFLVFATKRATATPKLSGNSCINYAAAWYLLAADLSWKFSMLIIGISCFFSSSYYYYYYYFTSPFF